MSAVNNKKRVLCSIIRKLCFVIILSLSLMLAGCSEVLTVGAVFLGAAVIDQTTKLPPKPSVPVVRAYVPPTPVQYNAPVAVVYKPPEPQIPRAAAYRSPDYQAMRDQAVSSYKDLSWNKSMAMFQELINENAPKDIQVESMVFLGAISYQNGNTDDAKNYFKHAKKLSPKLQPSPELFPPEMIKFYKSVKR
jgi:TolA-binding protein